MTGTADEIRTHNTLVGSQMLYQLNYCCIVYPKSTYLGYIILKLSLNDPDASDNSVGGVKKTLLVARGW